MASRRISIAATMAALLLSGRALAQTSALRTGGFRVTEGTLLHASAGAEAGYDTNVYYASTAAGPRGAGIFRATASLEYTNASRTGEVPSSLFFDLVGSLQYREYLSERVDARNRRAFIPQVGASAEFSGNQMVALTLSDSFARNEDPPYQPDTGPIVRYGNQFVVQTRLAPGGGRLQGVVRYTNSIDYFGESNVSYKYADAMTHEGMLDFSWRWLPKTALFAQVRQGYVQYFHPNQGGQTKVASYPLRAAIGLRGLVTPKTTIGIALGYANGFYSGNQESTGGILGSGYATVDVTYRPVLTTNVTLGYRHDFQNSLISNFYYLDGVYAGLQQQLLGRITIGISARWERRDFRGSISQSAMAGGVPVAVNRVDNFYQVGATVDATVKGGFYMGVGYNLLANDSDLMGPTPASNPDYLKHQVFGRLGIAY